VILQGGQSDRLESRPHVTARLRGPARQASTLQPGKAMHFEYRLNHRIPVLAWLLRVRPDGKALVEHGDWVETRERFFCEGAWSDSAFASGAFADASVFVGSGASLDADGNLVLVTATNTIERLQILRLGDEVLASNSLAFLLARSGDALHQGYKHYEWDFCSIIDGIDRCGCTITAILQPIARWRWSRNRSAVRRRSTRLPSTAITCSRKCETFAPTHRHRSGNIASRQSRRYPAGTIRRPRPCSLARTDAGTR